MKEGESETRVGLDRVDAAERLLFNRVPHDPAYENR